MTSLCLLILLLLSGCSTTLGKPPGYMMEACLEPTMGDQGRETVGTLVEYTQDLKTSLRGCNARMEALRDWFR